MQRPVIVAFASWLWPCRRRRSSNTATARAGPRQPSSVHTSHGSMAPRSTNTGSTANRLIASSIDTAPARSAPVLAAANASPATKTARIPSVLRRPLALPFVLAGSWWSFCGLAEDVPHWRVKSPVIPPPTKGFCATEFGSSAVSRADAQFALQSSTSVAIMTLVSRIAFTDGRKGCIPFG